MIQTQESLIIANFVARLKTTSPFSCESLPQGAEYCESDADVTLYERYIESDRSHKIQQCALDALSIIRDVYNGYADLHWNPGLKPPDVANFKVIYPILRSSIDCLMNQVTNIEQNNKIKTSDPKALYDDSSTLTFEGLFILIKASLEFLHPSAYSSDGVVLSQLISLLDNVSFSLQLLNSNLGCLAVYLCRVYIEEFMNRLPENGDLFLRQHSVMFYKVITLSVMSPGKDIDPNALLFLRRIINTILFILNTSINEPKGKINQQLVFNMSKFIDVWYGSLTKFLVNVRTDNLVFYLTAKPAGDFKFNRNGGTTDVDTRSVSNESSDSEGSEEDEDEDDSTVSEDRSSEESETETSTPDSRSDRHTNSNYTNNFRKSDGLMKNDKEQLLIKACKLIHETPLLPPSHRMRLITQLAYVLVEANSNELEKEALNGLLVLLDFSEDTNSSILKSNLLPLLKVLVKLMMNKVDYSVVGLVNVVDKAEVEKFVVLIYCLGQILSNVLKFEYEYDPENVDNFLQEQIRQMDPDNYEKSKDKEAEGDEDLDKLDEDRETARERKEREEMNKDRYNNKQRNHTEKERKEKKNKNKEVKKGNKEQHEYEDSEEEEDRKLENDMVLFEMTNSVMKLFHKLLNMNDDSVDEAITTVVCWMLREVKFEHTFKLAVPIACVFLRTKKSRMLDVIYGKSGNYTSTAQVAMSSNRRWLLGSNILKTSLDYYLCELAKESDNPDGTRTLVDEDKDLDLDLDKLDEDRETRREKKNKNKDTRSNKEKEYDGKKDKRDKSKEVKKGSKEQHEYEDNEEEKDRNRNNNNKEDENRKANAYTELDMGMRSLFSTVFDCYLDVLTECCGRVQEEMEECLGLYLTCFGFSDYFKRMPLEKLYLVPITSERYRVESYQYMIPVLKRQLNGFKMEVFLKYVMPVLNHLEYFVNKTRELKFTAANLSPEVESTGCKTRNSSKVSAAPVQGQGQTQAQGQGQGQGQGQTQTQVENSPVSESMNKDLDKLNRVHQQYEQVYNELLELLIPLSHDKEGIEALVKDEYFLLKFIVKLLDRGDEKFNTACKVISNFVKLDKVAIELIGILVKKFVTIEYKMDGDPDAYNKSDNILAAIGNVALFCSTEMLSRNLESFEKALGGRMNNYLIRLSKSLFPRVSDELKYKLYRNYMKSPKDKSIYGAIRTALETVYEKLQNDKELVYRLNNTGLNAFNQPNSLEKMNNMNFPMGVVGIKPINLSLIQLKNNDFKQRANQAVAKVEPGLVGEVNDKMDLDSNNTNNNPGNTNNTSNSNATGSTSMGVSTSKSNANVGTSSSTGTTNSSTTSQLSQFVTANSQNNTRLQGVKAENMGNGSGNMNSNNYVPTAEEEFVRMIVRVNGMSELASYLGILSETVDTSKQRINCLLTYTKLLVFIRNHLTNVDYSTLVALTMKPLIFECIVNSCVNNKNNRSYSYSIFENVFDFEGDYRHVLKVSLTILCNINDSLKKELVNMSVGTMKLLCYIFSKRFEKFDVQETMQLVIYLSNRLGEKSCNFYVHILKFFRVIVVKMDYDRMVQLVPHMMKLFNNEKCCEKGKLYVRRLVEKMLIRLKRDYLFSIFPKKHFPLLTNIIHTRKRKYKSIYEGRKSHRIDRNRLELEDDELDEEDQDLDLDKLDEEDLKEELDEYKKSAAAASNKSTYRKHDGILLRRKAAESHRLKKEKEENKDSKYVKLKDKGSRKEKVKVLKSIMKNKPNK